MWDFQHFILILFGKSFSLIHKRDVNLHKTNASTHSILTTIQTTNFRTKQDS